MKKPYQNDGIGVPSAELHRQKIARFYQSRKRMPTYAEMADILGFKSKNAAYKVVNRLVEAGALAKDADGYLLPRKLWGEIRKLGLVEAGFPSAAEEELTDTMSLDEYLIENKQASYLLEVKGDSMIEAGIVEGDLVIVERGKEPKPGQIVIAEVDGGWTMKYYRKQGAKVWLEPANPKYKPIYPENELKVAAIVRGVVRKY